MMSTPSIRTVGLTKRFGSFTALDQLNLEISGAKCVGFLGPNGAGKTTSLKILADLIFPTQGEAFLNGVSVRKDRKRALADTGVLIETPEIYASLSPREALGMVAELRGVPAGQRRARIDSALGEVKMMEWADAKVGKFSKGMKQRVNIAAALVHDPQLVLLDEPTSGLDPRGMAEVRDILRGLKRSHRLIFMSSHLLGEVADVCDEVAFIHRGKLLFYDTLARLTESANQGSGAAYDASFARPIEETELTGRLRGLPAVAAVERLGPDRVRFRLTGGPTTVEPFVSALAGLGLGLRSFTESESALEQTYLRLIDRGDG